MGRSSPSPIATTLSKICTKCGIEKQAKDFYKRYGRPGGPHLISMCKKCHKIKCYQDDRKAKKKNPQKYERRIWRNNLKKNYGITVDEYEDMYMKQEGLCAICRKPEMATTVGNKQPNRLSVDHSHVTGKNRKLLCVKCNMAIGLVSESAEILLCMVEYLKEYEK